jgi:hypothetical protein
MWPDALSDAVRDFACPFGCSLRYVLTGGHTAFADIQSKIHKQPGGWTRACEKRIEEQKPGGFENEIVLGDEFFREVTTHAIPTDLEAAKALSSSPAALDLFKCGFHTAVSPPKGRREYLSLAISACRPSSEAPTTPGLGSSESDWIAG